MFCTRGLCFTPESRSAPWKKVPIICWTSGQSSGNLEFPGECSRRSAGVAAVQFSSSSADEYFISGRTLNLGSRSTAAARPRTPARRRLEHGQPKSRPPAPDPLASRPRSLPVVLLRVCQRDRALLGQNLHPPPASPRAWCPRSRFERGPRHRRLLPGMRRQRFPR